MRCFNCGFEVNEEDRCPNCGIGLKTERKILYFSDYFYNDGLDKANVKDLTGAIIALKQSLKFNKYNIDARNLLGLLFLEIGEIVSALSQWVVSKNLRAENNRADKYLNEMRKDPELLEVMNQGIHHYNIALRNAKKKSYDMAVIQLKKALTMNGNLLRARQLLALLYMQRGDYARAKKEVSRCFQIDHGSTRSERYQSEIRAYFREGSRAKKKTDAGILSAFRSKNKGHEHKNEKKPIVQGAQTGKSAVQYQNGNEIIIQPLNRFRMDGTISVVSVGIGLVMGLLFAVYLILPDMMQKRTTDFTDKVKVLSEEADRKSVAIDDLEKQVKELNQTKGEMQQQIDEFEGSDKAEDTMDNLMMAAAAYISGTGKMEEYAGYMHGIHIEQINDAGMPGYQKLYEMLVERIGVKLSRYYFKQGASSFRTEDYKNAIKMYGLAFQYDAQNVDALYNLAESYRLFGDSVKAKQLYDQVIRDFPDSRKESGAEARLAEMKKQEEQDRENAQNSSNGSSRKNSGSLSTTNQNAGSQTTKRGR